MSFPFNVFSSSLNIFFSQCPPLSKCFSPYVFPAQYCSFLISFFSMSSPLNVVHSLLNLNISLSISSSLSILPFQCSPLSMSSPLVLLTMYSFLNIFLFHIIPSQCSPLSMSSPLVILTVYSSLNIFPSQCLPPSISSSLNISLLNNLSS